MRDGGFRADDEAEARREAEEMQAAIGRDGEGLDWEQIVTRAHSAVGDEETMRRDVEAVRHEAEAIDKEEVNPDGNDKLIDAILKKLHWQNLYRQLTAKFKELKRKCNSLETNQEELLIERDEHLREIKGLKNNQEGILDKITWLEKKREEDADAYRALSGVYGKFQGYARAGMDKLERELYNEKINLQREIKKLKKRVVANYEERRVVESLELEKRVLKEQTNRQAERITQLLDSERDLTNELRKLTTEHYDSATGDEHGPEVLVDIVADRIRELEEEDCVLCGKFQREIEKLKKRVVANYEEKCEWRRQAQEEQSYHGKTLRVLGIPVEILDDEPELTKRLKRIMDSRWSEARVLWEELVEERRVVESLEIEKRDLKEQINNQRETITQLLDSERDLTNELRKLTTEHYDSATGDEHGLQGLIDHIADRIRELEEEDCVLCGKLQEEIKELKFRNGNQKTMVEIAHMERDEAFEKMHRTKMEREATNYKQMFDEAVAMMKRMVTELGMEESALIDRPVLFNKLKKMGEIREWYWKLVRATEHPSNSGIPSPKTALKRIEKWRSYCEAAGWLAT